MASCNAGCDKVRLVDRCVRCNPGYSDKDQKDMILLATKWGVSLKEAERDYIKGKRR
jgi:hypothetical protein